MSNIATLADVSIETFEGDFPNAGRTPRLVCGDLAPVTIPAPHAAALMRTLSAAHDALRQAHTVLAARPAHLLTSDEMTLVRMLVALDVFPESSS